MASGNYFWLEWEVNLKLSLVASAKSVVVVILLIVVSSSSSNSKAVAVVAAGGKCSGSSSGGSRGGCSSGGGDPRAWITHPPFDPYPMDRGMDRVWVWVCDPSLMFLAVAIWNMTLHVNIYAHNNSTC